MAETSNLIVLTFEGTRTAAAAYEEIEKMEKEHLLEVEDAIIIERDAPSAPIGQVPAAYRPTTDSNMPPTSDMDATVRVHQTHGKKGKYAAKGAGIGVLAGWLLGGPIGGMAVGAGLGAITGHLKDFGIDDKKIATVRARLKPDSSALLVLGHAEDRDAVIEKLRSYDAQLVSTTLAPEVEQELRGRLANS